ncbi:hypothetical protein LY01_00923 [Nonlabens xylanidelens]|uniref:DUF4595 domain-containing protein n=1 Tax=Nonlabens xylanidelens TaxID=191564 RepID=A0A2S6ISS3_9FLAO|nr:hypothetical protein [Nonlabens xylanidelens]PPK97096.1 hypothetical protein LY01_00923 [Nonlabens xylanidelens]PQJ13780.1 hypothetical protein BST94_15685 [Nonlabens xylanidelens]
MKLFQLVTICALLIISCDDPSLDQQGDVDEIVDPIANLMELSSIQIAQGTFNNVTDNIDIVYNNDALISQILFTGTTNITYNIEYTSNNRLETITKVDATTLIYNFTYDEDFVFINFTDSNGDDVEMQLFTDTQNRINRVLTTVTDVSGISTQTEDLRYSYNANFNVDRINSLAANGFTVDAYSELTYEFSNNPFRDMNDVLRLLIFPDFVPYTRYVPITRENFIAASSGFTLENSFSFIYTLREDQFPSSREVVKTESGVSTTTFEIFNYL